MISLELARQLKDAGLMWKTEIHDFFAVPASGLEDKVFVLTDIMAYTELIRGWPVVGFHGAAEWALDYIYTSEVVWIPTEEQLREQLVAMLPEAGNRLLALNLHAAGYDCTIRLGDKKLTFAAPNAAEAYAAALLHILRIQDTANRV